MILNNLTELSISTLLSLQDFRVYHVCFIALDLHETWHNSLHLILMLSVCLTAVCRDETPNAATTVRN
jgi:hypothetical protein